MASNQSLVVVVRLFAIWLSGYYITTAPWFYVQTKKFSPDSAVLYTLGAAALILALAAALWYFASWIANRLIPGSSHAEEQSTAFDSWFSVGCALIGLWVLAKAIPALLHYFVANFMGAGMFPDTYVVTPEWHLTAIFNTIQLLFGLAFSWAAKDSIKSSSRFAMLTSPRTPSNIAVKALPSVAGTPLKRRPLP